MTAQSTQSNLKHAPATPLPWKVWQMPARWPERDQMYAAFTANAYPKLVEALREAVLDLRRHEADVSATDAEQVLRSLGEAV